MIASAKELESKGHRRSALLEAVVALEVALGQFSARKAGHNLPEGLQDRIELSSLKALIEKFGLRGSVAMLLPIMFTEEMLPAAVLSKCREAIDNRNNVVHRGKRILSEEDLRDWIRAIERCCVVLEQDAPV